jgi:hypothetical protein
MEWRNAKKAEIAHHPLELSVNRLVLIGNGFDLAYTHI